MLIPAHRGAPGYAPENARSAFTLAAHSSSQPGWAA
jgi:glycerophosphoryl diester phosphodiesterase